VVTPTFFETSKGELCFTTPDYGGRAFESLVFLLLAAKPVSFAAGLFASVDETRVVHGFCASRVRPSSQLEKLM
jgi:hypothetical protein